MASRADAPVGPTFEVAVEGVSAGAPAHPRLGPRGEGLVVATEQIVDFGGIERIAESVLAHYPAARLLAGRFDPSSARSGNDFEERISARAPAADRIDYVEIGGLRRHLYSPLYSRRLRAAPVDAATVLCLGAQAWTLAVRARPDTRLAGYMGGRPRPYYDHVDQYLREYPRASRPLLRASLPALRVHYRRMLARADVLATNSHWSAHTLETATGRRPRVVYPPVRTDFFTPAPAEPRHFLAVSRLRAHKRLDVLLAAFRRLREPLVIAGDGPWYPQLRADAPPNVTFVGHLADGDLRDLYRTSHALVSASVEEFGICLAEAQATGTPVVAPAAGGAAEIVRNGETGVLFPSVEPATVEAAVRTLRRTRIDPATCARSAERFSEPRFLAELGELI